MGDLVGIYLDQSGNVTKIVHADNDDFGPHADTDFVSVHMAAPDYAALPPPINVSGVAIYQDLAKAVAPMVAQIDAKIAAALQANIASVEAAIEKQSAEQQAAQLAALAAWNALTPDQQTAALKSDVPPRDARPASDQAPADVSAPVSP